MTFLLTQEPMVWPFLWLSFLIGYLSGSIPYGLILSGVMGLGDIRKSGSGNIGATNVLRVGGKKLAIATLLLDALKGAVPVLVAKQIHMDYAILAALGAFLGHLFPLWLKFKGGKGVATALGISFGFSLPLGLALVAVWLVTAFLTRYSSLAALTAFAAAPLLAACIAGIPQVTITLFFISVFIWVRHRENIRRLLKGEESKINLGKKAG